MVEGINILGLIKDRKFRNPIDQNELAVNKLARAFKVKLFGFIPYNSIFSGIKSGVSPLYTGKEIAQILVKNELTSNLEDALQEVDSFTDKRFSGKYGNVLTFEKYVNKDGEKRYRLESYFEGMGEY